MIAREREQDQQEGQRHRSSVALKRSGEDESTQMEGKGKVFYDLPAFEEDMRGALYMECSRNKYSTYKVSNLEEKSDGETNAKVVLPATGEWSTGEWSTR
jgi:hypothetical protein